MPDTYNYSADIERDEDSGVVVAFPDFGWGATDGATRDEALAEAKDLLRELISKETARRSETLPLARSLSSALGAVTIRPPSGNRGEARILKSLHGISRMRDCSISILWRTRGYPRFAIVPAAGRKVCRKPWSP